MTAATLAPPEPALLTAEEFAAEYADRPAELVKGRVVEVPMAHFKHGKICYRVSMALGAIVEARDLGHILINDARFVTERDPDTTRGADISFVTYARLPKGPIPDGLLDIVPDLTVEVRSPTDRWGDLFAKVGEYLNAGVAVVVVLDPATGSASVYRPDGNQQIFGPADTLTVPDVLPGFAVPVAKFFE